MNQNYRVFLTGIIVFTLIIVSTLMLFGAIGASEVSTTECKPYFMGRGCDEIPKQIQPCPIQRPDDPCPLLERSRE